MKKLILFALIPFLIYGCSNTTFDTSSKEAFTESVETASKNLDDDEKEQLAKAMMFYSFKDLNLFSDTEPEYPSSTLKDKFEGKTAKEVIKIFKQDQKNDLTKEIQEEIKILEERKTTNTAAKDLLDQFEVSGRFAITDGYFGKDSEQTIKIKNNSKKTISRFKVNTRLVSVNREVPWGKDSISYSIPGGLASGEELEESFSADWTYIDFGDNTPLLKVDLVFVEDPDGNKLFENLEFTKEDAEKLVKLKKDLLSQ